MSIENPIDTSSAKRYAILLDVGVGRGPDAYSEGYTNWSHDIQDGSSNYESRPDIAVSLPKIEGNVEEPTFTITAPRVGAFALFGLGESVPPIVIGIDEVDPEDTSTRRRIYRAEVVSALVNPRGQSGLIELRMKGIKHRLTISLGIVAASTCPWAFGDRQCCVDLTDKTFAATVNEVSGNLVTLDLPSGVDPLDDDHWRNGVLSYQGLRIRIRKVSSSGFTLSRVAPASWEGKTITAIYGCDKTLRVCGDIWNNVERWGGIGLAMPDFNPQIEDAP